MEKPFPAQEASRSNRPTQEQIREVFGVVRRTFREDHVECKRMAGRFFKYASGKGNAEERARFYPGWADEDFRCLLQEMRDNQIPVVEWIPQAEALLDESYKDENAEAEANETPPKGSLGELMLKKFGKR